jgi:uncharacterized membrane protein
MISDGHSQSKRPASAVLAGPYGHPFHPIMVTVPIGAWIASFVFDLASRIVDKPGFLTQGSEMLIAIGVVGALAAAMLGFLDLFAIPSGTRAYRTALLHMTLNLLVTTAYGLGFWWRYGGHDDGDPVATGQIILSAISLAALALSGSLGGKLAYHYGVRVADEDTQAQGFATTSAAHDHPTH